MPALLTARSTCPKASAERLSDFIMCAFGFVAVLKPSVSRVCDILRCLIFGFLADDESSVHQPLLISQIAVTAATA